MSTFRSYNCNVLVNISLIYDLAILSLLLPLKSGPEFFDDSDKLLRAQVY